LEIELLHPRFVGGDGRALHADAVALDGVGRVDGDLVVGGVPMLHPQVVIVELEVEIREDQLVFDQLPDDAGHLVAVEVDDGIGDFDLARRLGHRGRVSGGLARSERRRTGPAAARAVTPIDRPEGEGYRLRYCGRGAPAGRGPSVLWRKVMRP